jgi:hypothetical protein
MTEVNHISRRQFLIFLLAELIWLRQSAQPELRPDAPTPSLSFERWGQDTANLAAFVQCYDEFN